jgi:2-C-methyl-D-erythritol 4-phosphate cytidylyltransferase
MGGDTPKQFRPLAGRPVLMHSVERFHTALPDAQIIITLPVGESARWEELCRKYDFAIAHSITHGGATRCESVRNALEICAGCDYIAVHDGARPLVSVELILRLLDDAVAYDAAIPVVAPVDSFRIIEGDIESDSGRCIDRSRLRAVQTPQIFAAPLLRAAYAAPAEGAFTDDASLVERLGVAVHLSRGEPFNIKITHQADFAIAEALLRPD